MSINYTKATADLKKKKEKKRTCILYMCIHAHSWILICCLLIRVGVYKEGTCTTRTHS